MSKVLENRKSSFALATKKEIELTHLLSIAYVIIYNSYVPSNIKIYELL